MPVTLDAVRRLFWGRGGHEEPTPAGPPAPTSAVLAQYLASPPSPQNALDIFTGEWSSALPAPFSELRAGTIELFADARIDWLLETIGGVRDKQVLELGPLEAGHTYMLEKGGAASVTAIESNTRAFLKCLIVKEVLELRRARFLCGDFIEFLRRNTQTFEVCLASGVLYHMPNPVELIALLAQRCSEYLFLWTHYYEGAIIGANPTLAPKFVGSVPAEHGGFTHTLHRQEYQAALEWTGFCGGSAPTSHWMTRDDIGACLQHFGFEIDAVGFEQPDHPNGPALAMVARRRVTSTRLTTG